MSDTFDHEADAWDSLLFGQDADGEYISWDSRNAHRIVVSAPEPKTCNHCGQSGLRWQQVNGFWRLYQGRSEHICGSIGASSLFRKLVPRAT
jgi:hypothetical protein